MLKERILIVFMLTVFSLTATAATVNDVMNVAAKKTEAAQNSQNKIDAVVESSQNMLEEYKQVSKSVESLTLYNHKLAIQVEQQREYLQQIERSRKNAMLMQRQILPTLEKMINVLDEFIQLDMPFYLAEREERIAFLRANIDRPDLSLAEKFRQVLEAYQIENEYGRKIDTYYDTIEIAGVKKEVTILRVGRMALLYQTADFIHSGLWDKQQKTWRTLQASDELNAIKQGIKMANKQLAVSILEIPVPVAEVMP
jgi:hypothetical protein